MSTLLLGEKIHIYLCKTHDGYFEYLLCSYYIDLFYRSIEKASHGQPLDFLVNLVSRTTHVIKTMTGLKAQFGIVSLLLMCFNLLPQLYLQNALRQIWSKEFYN